MKQTEKCLGKEMSLMVLSSSSSSLQQHSLSAGCSEKILIIPCTLLYCHNTIKVWIQSKRRGKRCNNYVFWKKALLLLSVVSQIHITSAHYASFPTFCLGDKSVYHTVKTDGYVLGKDKAVSVQCMPKVFKPFQTFSFRGSHKNSTSNMWNKKQFCFIL